MKLWSRLPGADFFCSSSQPSALSSISSRRAGIDALLPDVALAPVSLPAPHEWLQAWSLSGKGHQISQSPSGGEGGTEEPNTPHQCYRGCDLFHQFIQSRLLLDLDHIKRPRYLDIGVSSGVLEAFRIDAHFVI